MDRKKIRKNWLIYAVTGLVLIGFGLSLLGEAIILKFQTKNWFWIGTAALIVFNGGLSIFGKAIIYKMKLIK